MRPEEIARNSSGLSSLRIHDYCRRGAVRSITPHSEQGPDSSNTRSGTTAQARPAPRFRVSRTYRITDTVTLSKTIESRLRQRRGRAFFVALGLRFGQAGNSGLVQTFLVGYIASTLLMEKSMATTVNGSLIGFVTIPVIGFLGDKFGRRPMYMILSGATMVLAFPLLWLVTSGNNVSLVLGMVLALNIGVLGLFSPESVTMAELFDARTRFTQLALAKDIGGILATAIGPLLAATLTTVTGSWWPIAAMLLVYSAITLVSAYLAPETHGRDLVRLDDAI